MSEDVAEVQPAQPQPASLFKMEKKDVRRSTLSYTKKLAVHWVDKEHADHSLVLV